MVGGMVAVLSACSRRGISRGRTIRQFIAGRGWCRLLHALLRPGSRCSGNDALYEGSSSTTGNDTEEVMVIRRGFYSLLAAIIRRCWRLWSSHRLLCCFYVTSSVDSGLVLGISPRNRGMLQPATPPKLPLRLLVGCDCSGLLTSACK